MRGMANQPKKLVLKKLTLRKLTLDESGDIFGGVCCGTAICGPNPPKDTDGCPDKVGVGWSLGLSFSIGPSKFGVSVGLSWSWSVGY
jgi:hypothetical protein